MEGMVIMILRTMIKDNTISLEGTPSGKATETRNIETSGHGTEEVIMAGNNVGNVVDTSLRIGTFILVSHCKIPTHSLRMVLLIHIDMPIIIDMERKENARGNANTTRQWL